MNGLRTVIAVAFGGALGAGCRWGLLSLFSSAEDVRLIFLFNILGSALLGVLISQRPNISENWFHFGGAGVAGGFTTFSTFAVDVAELIDSGQLIAAAVSTGVTAVIALVFAGIGYRVGLEIKR